MRFYVYIIQSEKDESYYVGSTKDLAERVGRHNQGRSKYTKGRRPWELVYHEELPDRSSAMNREQEIKGHKRKAFIEFLVRTSPIPYPIFFTSAPLPIGR
jgi:putative endonuclease